LEIERNKYNFAAHLKILNMIIVPLKEGENIERALKKFKRKFEKTGTMRNSVLVRPLLNLQLEDAKKLRRLFTFRTYSKRKSNILLDASGKNA